MERVWIDWGSGRRELVQCYEFKTLAEMNAFLEGVSAAAQAFDVSDFTQFDSEDELHAHNWEA